MSKERSVKDHWMILRCGVKIWNRWIEANPRTRPILMNTDLANANLRNAALRGAWLTEANLSGADLSGADLSGAKLQRANLTGTLFYDTDLQRADLSTAKLEGAYLVKADFSRAYLSNTTLTDAVFSGTNLTEASLWGANLEGAKLSDTIFHDVNLGVAKGLAQAIHRSPSPISAQTLGKSSGRIDEEFLKGCGFQDWEVLAAKLHSPNLRPDQVSDIGYEVINLRATSPIVPLSVFISYCHADTAFVEKLEARFDSDRIRYWRDVHDLKAGPIEQQVDRAIGFQRASLLVLSKKSVESDWVEHEVEHAREVEKKRREEGRGEYLLCPITLDKAWKRCRWPRRIQRQIQKYNVLDFSHWGNDGEFERQYEKLKIGLGIYYADRGAGPE